MSKAFDKEKVYDDEIAPLMDKIIKICKENDIPIACTFQYKGDEENSDYCTTVLTAAETTSDDMISLGKAHARLVEQRSSGYVLAETITTDDNGNKHVTIQRIS